MTSSSTNPFDEHSVVALTSNLPGTKLKKGETGTIVHVYKDGTAYEVEFFDANGNTRAVETVEHCLLCRENPLKITWRRTTVQAVPKRTSSA